MRRWIALLALALVACATAPAPRTPPVPRAGQRVHQVVAGENAYRIAKKYGVTVEALAALNHLESPESLAVGQRLLVPGPGPAPAAEPPGSPPPPPPDPDDELAQVKAQLGQEPRPPPPGCEAHRGTATSKASAAGLIWPVDGVIVGKFGQRDGERHDGLDIGAADGTPIYSAAAGEVIFSGEQAGYGLLVIVRHPDGRSTIYARNAKNCVAAGQKVAQGDLLALVGRSEGADAPYLHFELRGDKGPINPRAQLP